MSLTRRARGCFAPKQFAPAPPGAPQRAGFGLGPPALFSAQAGENRAPGGATGPFFRRRREKIAWGGLLGGAAGDALRFSFPLTQAKGTKTPLFYIQVIHTINLGLHDIHLRSKTVFLTRCYIIFLIRCYTVFLVY